MDLNEKTSICPGGDSFIVHCKDCFLRSMVNDKDVRIYALFHFKVVLPSLPRTQSRMIPSGHIHPATYDTKMLPNTSLAFSFDAHTRTPPAESCVGSAMDAPETIRLDEVVCG